MELAECMILSISRPGFNSSVPKAHKEALALPRKNPKGCSSRPAALLSSKFSYRLRDIIIGFTAVSFRYLFLQKAACHTKRQAKLSSWMVAFTTENQFVP